MTYGQRIKQIRKQLGLNQGDFAFDVGVAQRTISDWELGKNTPHKSTVERVADNLGMTVSELLEGVTE